MRKIAVLKTDFTIVTSDIEQRVEVVGHSAWDIQVEFVQQERQISLDENGDLFEPEFRLRLEAKQKDKYLLDGSYSAKALGSDIKEIQTLFEFIEQNSRYLFEELGFRGVLV